MDIYWAPWHLKLTGLWPAWNHSTSTNCLSDAFANLHLLIFTNLIHLQDLTKVYKLLNYIRPYLHFQRSKSTGSHDTSSSPKFDPHEIIPPPSTGTLLYICCICKLAPFDLPYMKQDLSEAMHTSTINHSTTYSSLCIDNQQLHWAPWHFKLTASSSAVIK